MGWFDSRRIILLTAAFFAQFRVTAGTALGKAAGFNLGDDPELFNYIVQFTMEPTPGSLVPSPEEMDDQPSPWSLSPEVALMSADCEVEDANQSSSSLSAGMDEGVSAVNGAQEDGPSFSVGAVVLGLRRSNKKMPADRKQSWRGECSRVFICS